MPRARVPVTALHRAGLALGLLIASVDMSARAAEPDPIERLAAHLTPPLAAVLYPLPPLPSPPEARTQPDKLHKLQWMAELGHRVDARDHHSASRAWRTIMHWPEPGDTLFTYDGTAPDTSLERYPVPAGRADPAVDFAASIALGWLDERHFSCDFPLRARYLAAHDLIARPTRFERGECRAFERWAALDTVEAVEALYVTPSWSDASASMGHIVFRVRRAGGERVTAQSPEPVFAYAAVEPAETTPGYIVRGLTGGLTTRLKLETMGQVYHRYGEVEGRDLVLYELVLSKDELRYLLAEVYAQVHQRAAVPYAFLAVNCASLAWDLLESALPDLGPRPALMTHPHEVVSHLLTLGRARPKALLPSRYTRAALAERRFDRLYLALDKHPPIPGLAALNAVRTGPMEARAAALRALDTVLAGRSLDPAQARDLAAYVDALIDAETWAIDRRQRKVVTGATSPALDAAREVRVRLPMGDDDRFVDLPPAAVVPSGSRARALALGYSGAVESRPVLRFSLAILDEAVGEGRAVLLRNGGRMVVLRAETTLALDPFGLEEERVVIADLATWSHGPETELGGWASRLGFHLAAETLTRPRDDLDLAVRLRGGLGLTLAASRDFADHLVFGVDLEGSSWSNGAADLRVAAGPFIEAGLGLGPQRLRLLARALPGWSFAGADSAFGWGFESTATLDLVLDRAAGVLLRTALAAHWDLPIRDAWELTLGLVW